MYLKSIPYVFLFLLLSSCTIQKKEVNLTENKIIDTDGFFDSYFGGYPILFKETTFKPEAYNKIFFIKKDVIENNLDNILLKLKKNGWLLVDKAEGYYYYCYGTNYSLGVVVPKDKKIIKSNGNEVKYYDFSSVNFTLSYLKYGIYSCLDVK